MIYPQNHSDRNKLNEILEKPNFKKINIEDKTELKLYDAFMMGLSNDEKADKRLLAYGSVRNRSDDYIRVAYSDVNDLDTEAC